MQTVLISDILVDPPNLIDMWVSSMHAETEQAYDEVL